jgi:hypothetical protein
MAIVQTYQGIVRQGKIQLSSTAELPEGSHVIVSVTEDAEKITLLDPHIARRKANGWLVSFVGSVMAQQPQLEQVEGRLVWHFKAFLTMRGHPLQGPVGRVAVDAYTGEVLADEEAAAEMIARGTAIARSLLPAES